MRGFTIVTIQVFINSVLDHYLHTFIFLSGWNCKSYRAKCSECYVPRRFHSNDEFHSGSSLCSHSHRLPIVNFVMLRSEPGLNLSCGRYCVLDNQFRQDNTNFEVLNMLANASTFVNTAGLKTASIFYWVTVQFKKKAHQHPTVFYRSSPRCMCYEDRWHFGGNNVTS